MSAVLSLMLMQDWDGVVKNWPKNSRKKVVIFWPPRRNGMAVAKGLVVRGSLTFGTCRAAVTDPCGVTPLAPSLPSMNAEGFPPLIRHA